MLWLLFDFELINKFECSTGMKRFHVMPSRGSFENSVFCAMYVWFEVFNKKNNVNIYSILCKLTVFLLHRQDYIKLSLVILIENSVRCIYQNFF